MRHPCVRTCTICVLAQAFRLWRATVRRIMYERVRNDVDTRIFGNTLILQPYLHKTQAIAVQMSETSVMLVSEWQHARHAFCCFSLGLVMHRALLWRV